MQGENCFTIKFYASFTINWQLKEQKLRWSSTKKYFVDDGYDGGGGIVDYKSYLFVFVIFNFKFWLIWPYDIKFRKA